MTKYVQNAIDRSDTYDLTDINDTSYSEELIDILEQKQELLEQLENEVDDLEEDEAKPFNEVIEIVKLDIKELDDKIDSLDYERKLAFEKASGIQYY